MANDFSWKRDIKNVDWQSTLKYNLIRSAAAGIVWGVLMLATDPARNVVPAIFAPVSFLVGYLIFFLPFGLAASAAARLPLPYAGLLAGGVAALLSLMIAVGDPLVYLLFKQKPEWIPVDHPGIFNFRLIIFIIRDPSQPRLPRAASPVPPPQSTAPDLATSPPSSQTVAPSSQGSPGGTTQSSFAPQSATTFFRSKPFIVLVIAAVVLCGGVALFKSLAEKTALSFEFSLDGKALSAGKLPDVRVDGQPFTSGSKIGMGRHEITVQLQDAESLDQHFWVVFGAKNLGTLPLEASKGSLTVAVNPSPANVVVRRAAETVGQGEAPLKIEKLPVGEYVLVVRRGEYEETQSVNVRRQQRTEAKVDLKLGSADLSAEPADAEFELSGGGRHWQGKLPMRISDVPAGNYSLLARRKGWELSADVSVSRGNIITNKVEFQYGSLAVTSDPSGLVVSTNGVEAGKTPTVVPELRPGSYVVTVTDGESDLTAEVSVGPKEKASHPFVFRYGVVQVESVPAGATIVRRGKKLGKTTLTIDRVPAGEMTVELQLQGYAPTNCSIIVQEGKTAHFTAKLVSERYLAAVKEAQQALDANQLEVARKAIAVAVEYEPSAPDIAALSKELAEKTAASKQRQLDAQRQAANDRLAATSSTNMPGVAFSGEWRGSLTHTASHLGRTVTPAGNFRLVVYPDLRSGMYYGAQGGEHPVVMSQAGGGLIIKDLNGTITLKMQIGADRSTATIHQRVDPGDGTWAEAEGIFYSSRVISGNSSAASPSSSPSSSSNPGSAGNSSFEEFTKGVRNAGLFDNHTKEYPFPYDKVWDAALQVLTEQKEKIIRSEKDNGFLMTELTRHGLIGFPSHDQYCLLLEKVNDSSAKMTFKLLTYYVDCGGKKGPRGLLQPDNKDFIDRKAQAFLKKIDEKLQKSN